MSTYCTDGKHETVKHEKGNAASTIPYDFMINGGCLCHQRVADLVLHHSARSGIMWGPCPRPFTVSPISTKGKRRHEACLGLCPGLAPYKEAGTRLMALLSERHVS